MQCLCKVFKKHYLQMKSPNIALPHFKGKNAKMLGPGTILILRSEGECGSEMHAFIHLAIFMKHLLQLRYYSRHCRYSSEQKRKGSILVEVENTHKNEQMPCRKQERGCGIVGVWSKVLLCVEGGQGSSYPKERTSGCVGVWEKGGLCRGSLCR